MKKNKLNNEKKIKTKKKTIGFTLIELLAVIIILGILITIAVVGVSRYIRDSRKDTYVATAKSYLSSALNHVNAERLEMFDEGVTYYLPEKCVPMEKARKSPNGDFKEAYVAVTYDKKDSFKYYWMSRDNIDEGFYLTKGDLLEKALVQHSMEELKPNIEIESRTKIMVLNDNCNLDGVVAIDAQVMMTGDNITAENIDDPIIPADLYPTIATGFEMWKGINKSIFETIKIEKHKNVPTNAVKSWDISEKKDGSAIAWYLDSDNNGLYELYMGGEGGLSANILSYSLFEDFNNVKEIDLLNFNTSKVVNMAGMFSGCINLITLNLKNFNTKNVKGMHYLFYNCKKLINLNISSFDTLNVNNMYMMFAECSELIDLDVSSFNTSKVTNMGDMFFRCKKLKKLNLNNFDTSNVTSMYMMFSDCLALTSLDLSSFNTSKVTNMGSMFSFSKNLTSINLNNFDTSNVTDMRAMFYECNSLTILNLNSFDTSKLVSMNSMFYGCTKLNNLKIVNFELSNIENINYAFYGFPSTCLIEVGTQAAKDKLLEKFPNLNIIIV